MNKNIDTSIIKIRNAVTTKLQIIKNAIRAYNSKNIENNSTKPLSETSGKNIERTQSQNIHQLLEDPSSKPRDIDVMTLEQLEKELKNVLKEKADFMIKRFELSDKYCDLKMDLENYLVTDKKSQKKADRGNEKLEEMDYDLQWYSHNIKDYDEVIREIEKKIALLKNN